MKDFLKYTFASLLGVILAGVVLSVLSILTLVAMLTSSDTETKVKENSIFVLDFQGTLSERAQANPFDRLLGEDSEDYGLDDILTSIRKAKENDNIRGIYLQPGYLDASFASLQEIRHALLDFKESGKFVVAYADQYTQGMYYLASVADRLMVNPQGSIGWHGLASQPVFYKNLLDKAGIDMQVFRVGAYKSAVEPFTSTEMSQANREQMNALLQSVWGGMTADVAASRGLTAEKLDSLADRYMDLRTATDYVACGLADTLLYKDGVTDCLKRLTDRDEDENLRLLYPEDMLGVKRNVPRDKSGNIIAVYYASGEIVDEASTASLAGDEQIDGRRMAADLRRLRDDDDVKAVVLRVNSPGGSAYASEQIWREVVRLKEKKPVVVSMGDYAASGGYYISCAATTIYADPATLTGSIGIFGMFPSGEKLFRDKLGLRFDVVKTNRLSDMGAGLGILGARPMDEAERELLQAYVDNGYRLFVNRCAEGRGMTVEEIDEIAQGRVWTGEAAKELGLVDELGGIGAALEAAARLADVEHYSIVSQPEQESAFMSLISGGKQHYVDGKLRERLGILYDSYRTLERLQDAHPVQARLPFDPNIR